MGNKINDEEQNRIKLYLQLIEKKIMQLSDKREYDIENFLFSKKEQVLIFVVENNNKQNIPKFLTTALTMTLP